MFSGSVKSVKYAFGFVRLPEKWVFPKGECLQLVRADRVHGKKHLLHCILLTEKAFSEGTNLANKKNMELLLRLAGTDQVKEAVNALAPEKEALLVVFGEGSVERYEKALNELNALEFEGSFNDEGLKEAMEKAALIGL